MKLVINNFEERMDGPIMYWDCSTEYKGTKVYAKLVRNERENYDLTVQVGDKTYASKYTKYLNVDEIRNIMLEKISKKMASQFPEITWFQMPRKL